MRSPSSRVPSPVNTPAIDFTTPFQTVPFPRVKFVQNDGQPHAKRRRISAACKTCRKRKTRCSGEKPMCETCKQTGQECLGYSDPIPKGLPRQARRDSKSTSDGQSTERTRFFGSQNPRPHQRHASQPAVLPSHLSLRGISPRRQENSILHMTEGDIKRKQGMGDDFDHGMTEDCDSPELTYELPIATPRANRMPYFRYFGPTAIVPGYKQMVVEVRDPRPASSQSVASSSTVTSPVSSHDSVTPAVLSQQVPTMDESLPLYEPHESGHVHPLIFHLVDTFFIHLGSNFPFLRKKHFIQEVESGRADMLLVDAVCSVSARFSTHHLLCKRVPNARGVHFSARAKTHVVDRFACPNLPSVQACLLLAYSEFGSNRDSGLWMFLGCAIRMAQDLGLHKLAGMRGEHKGRAEERKRAGSRSFTPDQRGEEGPIDDKDPKEAAEQERTDTFWAVYFLDRVISSGTGRPVTLKDSEIEIAMPPLEEAVDDGNYPQPFPALIRVINLYGKATDVLNDRTTKHSDDTSDTLKALAKITEDLHEMYQKLSRKLDFNAPNFQHYVKAHQASVFLLHHFWFHALIVLLHRPTLLVEGRTPQLFPNSHELSMSSAKTIADMFQFSEAMGLDIKAAGNPFTSQPLYIAACAFLQESASRTSNIPMPAVATLSLGSEPTGETASDHIRSLRKSQHSFVALASQQDYQHCYKALKDIEPYWGGVGYILTVMDQKAKGIVDPLLYTDEEMESSELWRPKVFDLLKRTREMSTDPTERNHHSAGVQSRGEQEFPGEAIGVSMTGLTDSPTSVLNFMYQPDSPASYTTASFSHMTQQQ
ncbi:hypothetical protein K440DRAFT_592176, partial [Wilcoxina mikolae CBS 423.85]